MKKIFLFFAVSTITGSAFAQMNFNYGIRAGANFTTLTDKSTDGRVANTSYKAGFRAGVFGELSIGEGIGLEANILYNQMGGKIDFKDGMGNTFKSTLNLDYLTIPINFKYYIPNVTGLSAFAGPQLGFLLNSKFDKTTQTLIEISTEATTSDIKKSFQSFDIAGNIGVEYQLPIGVRFSALYQYSFGNIYKDKDNTTTTHILAGNAVNSGFSVTVGYAFGGKKK